MTLIDLKCNIKKLEEKRNGVLCYDNKGSNFVSGNCIGKHLKNKYNSNLTRSLKK